MNEELKTEIEAIKPQVEAEAVQVGENLLVKLFNLIKTKIQARIAARKAKKEAK